VVNSIATSGAPSQVYLGGQTCLTNTVSISSSTSETQIIGTSAFPANTMAAGTTYHFRAYAIQSNTGTTGNVTFRIRIGTTSLSGAVATTFAPNSNTTNAASNSPYWLDGYLTIRSAGSGGTAMAEMNAVAEVGTAADAAFVTATPVSVTTATVAVDTTASNLVELTVQPSLTAFTINYYVACIEVVKP
jgi:hypothetical protein